MRQRGWGWGVGATHILNLSFFQIHVSTREVPFSPNLDNAQMLGAK